MQNSSISQNEFMFLKDLRSRLGKSLFIPYSEIDGRLWITWSSIFVYPDDNGDMRRSMILMGRNIQNQLRNPLMCQERVLECVLNMMLLKNELNSMERRWCTTFTKLLLKLYIIKK